MAAAWLGNFKMLEPFRPLFLSAAAIALFVAWPCIYRPAVACKAGEVCAAPRVRSVYKAPFWGVAALIGASTISPYVLPLFY
ncbi:mercuric transporter MerT family protein [Methylocystis sp.]|uniref:mercuric transporter MerT family protein n=1 Tax=Methylocystis sp. TaxID=1911079 RepID=UPI003DA3D4FF